MPNVGLQLLTLSLRVTCSTEWASQMPLFILIFYLILRGLAWTQASGNHNVLYAPPQWLGGKGRYIFGKAPVKWGLFSVSIGSAGALSSNNLWRYFFVVAVFGNCFDITSITGNLSLIPGTRYLSLTQIHERNIMKQFLLLRWPAKTHTCQWDRCWACCGYLLICE